MWYDKNFGDWADVGSIPTVPCRTILIRSFAMYENYFEELDAYNAKDEYEEWLDDQEEEFLATIDQENQYDD